MISLEEAIKLPKEELKNLKQDLIKKIQEKKDLNAYIEIKDSGDGVPILIKDNIQVKDWNISCASKILQNYISPYNATVINKLKNNGLSPFGRANMDEFAMGSTTSNSYYGKTLNPVDKNKVPGGSSGGSAAAVAANIAIAALGSDTGGSVRQPAAFCGCVGMKPSYGRVSRYGLSAYASSLDQIGPITKNVKDNAILYDIISGYDEKDDTSANIEYKSIYKNLNINKKFKIAILDSYIKDANEEIKIAYENTIKLLEEDGHTIIKKELNDPKYDISSYYITASAEASANLGRYDGVRYGFKLNGKDLKESYVKTRTQGFSDEVKKRILMGSFVLSSGFYDDFYIKAQKVRNYIKNEYKEIFKDVDLILSPVTPTTAFEFDKIQNPLEMYLSDIYTVSVNLAGLPALSLPVAKDKKGLPIGLQFITKQFNEQDLFDASLRLENILKEY